MQSNAMKIRSGLLLLGIFACVIELYFPILSASGLMVDDWGQLKNYKLEIWTQFKGFFPLWSNRPLGPVLLVIITRLFGMNESYYFVLNSSIFLSSIALLSVVISKEFGKFVSVVFFLLAIQPIISDTFTYSPINEITPVCSIFLWSISVYLQCSSVSTRLRSLLLFSIVITALLIYEIILPLLLLNFFIAYGKSTNKNIFNSDSIAIFLALLIVLVWQTVLAKIFFGTVFSRLNFAPISQVPKIVFTFLMTIVEVAKLCIASLRKTSIEAIVLYLLYFAVLALALGLDASNKKLRNLNFKHVFIFFILYLSCSVLYILSNSTPNIHGYDNRGLSSSWIGFSMAFVMFTCKTFASSLRFRTVLLATVLFLVSNLFLVRAEEFKFASQYRHEIVKDLTSKIKTLHSKESFNFIAYIDCFLPGALNQTTIFCVPWDLAPAVELFSGQISNGAVFHAENMNISNGQIYVDGWFSLPVVGTYLYVYDKLHSKGNLVVLSGDINSKDKLLKYAEKLKNHANKY